MSNFITGEHAPDPGDRPPTPPRRAYVPAVGPRLKILLLVVFALAALLGANSVYLSSVTALEYVSKVTATKETPAHTYQNWFYQIMFAGHLGLGLLFVLPFIAFGLIHLFTARHRKNRRAVRVGYSLFVTSIVLLVTGFLLVRLDGLFDLKQPLARSVVYWAHVGAPLACLWLYWLHRLAGRKIQWRLGLGYAVAVAALVGGMISLHSADPRAWNVSGPKAGAKYFQPSLALTSTGNFIPAEKLMDDEYCLACHADVHAGWKDSVHHFSSFNNPAYLASVRETRQVAFERDGNVQASRWCAGCHDPVPFFSGAFDDPKFDDVNHPTAHAGITCSVCHAITHVNSTKGNADYTIEEPEHYPFAYADEGSALQWVNHQLIKAKPAMHKKTFLKDFHKSAEFCSTCHKVHIPGELNHYKDFLRGQNHYDTYLLSGVSGHGARSFYYPEKAQANCNECHMPRAASNDFGAKPYADSKGALQVHDHLFPAANTGIAWLKDREKAVKAHQDFLKEKLRVDLFGVREEGRIDGNLIAPLRPNVPTLEPGKTYLFETVIRTLKMGHPFTQGTTDSNEVWLDVTVRSGDRIVGRSGVIDGQGRDVDPWSHYVNNFVIDRNGNRINRRNPQDIFTTLYNHQIPPGAAQTVHYGFTVPEGLSAPLTFDVKLQYRKFDSEYMRYVAEVTKPGDQPLRGHKAGEPYVNNLPITTLATDSVTFPVDGVDFAVENPVRDIPEWQRWNDYGIGQLLKGKAELRQAAEAFEKVEALKRYDGPLNLARVLLLEGRIDEATAALNRAAEYTDPAAPPWTMGWLSGTLNREQGRLEEAERDFRGVLETRTPEMVERGFDFSIDIEVINLLGQTLFDRARQIRGDDRAAKRDELHRQAVARFEKTLTVDSEDVTAHYNLSLLYDRLGDEKKAGEHRALHARYKPDDNATDRAVRLAREKYPAANHAAEAVVIYDLARPGAFGLGGTETAARPDGAAQ